VEGHEIFAGNLKLLKSIGLHVEDLEAETQWLREFGHGVLYVVIDQRIAGHLSVRDPIKESAREAINYFQRQGVQVVMVTGDHRMTASSVARELGIPRVIADVLPSQKKAIIETLQHEGHPVALVGDGINDAPALAQAHVGVAMGTGTDVAMQTAGIVLVGGDLAGTVRAHKLSRSTMRNIRQNLLFAFVYNFLGLPVAAGALYPFLGVLLSPMIASAAMSLSSVSVIGNALRLNRIKL